MTDSSREGSSQEDLLLYAEEDRIISFFVYLGKHGIFSSLSKVELIEAIQEWQESCKPEELRNPSGPVDPM